MNPAKPAILSCTSILALAALPLAAMLVPLRSAAAVTVGEGETMPTVASVPDGETIILAGNPALLTGAYNLGAKGLIIRSDTPGTYRTLSNGAVNRIIDMQPGGERTFDYIIFSGGSVSGGNDGAGLRISGGDTAGTTTLNGNFIVSNNTNSGRHGGGLSVTSGNIIFGGSVRFENNVTDQRGGGIYLGVANCFAQFTGDAVFISNTAGLASAGMGGAIQSQNATTPITFKASSTFIDNTANNNNGGAILSSGDIEFQGATYFKGNTITGASGGGGAIFVNNGRTLTISKGIVAIENTVATGNGGALYTRGNFYIAGSSTFTGNSAGGDGGALYMYVADASSATGTFDASLGDIIFSGNTHKNASTSVANAIVVRTAANINSTLIFNTGTAANAHTIAFHDPIAGSSVSGTVTILQNGDGTLLFDSHTSTITAATTVNSGTFKLANGAVYGNASSNGGSFQLASSAALLANGTIRAGSITIGSGASLEVLDGGVLMLDTPSPLVGAGLRLAGSGTFNVAGGALSASSIVVGPAQSALAQTLVFAPSTALTLENGATIAIDLIGGADSDKLIADTLTLPGTVTIDLIGNSGTYTILTADNSTFDTTSFNFLVNGIAPSARYAATPAVNSINAGAGSELVVEFLKKNLGLTWTGAAPGELWKHSASTDANWTDSGAIPESFFQNGDSVLFTDAATNKTIIVDAAGVIVAGMTVNNTTGAYTFAGSGNITSSTTATAGGLITPTGKLVKTGAGTLNFENTSANNFVAGIEISGGVIGFTTDGQLGDGGNGIHFTGDATLRANAANATLANKLIVDANRTATLDTAGHTLTYTGDLAGVAATGTLAKTGAGILRLTTSHAGYAASTLVSQGTLNLATTAAVLGGRIDIANGGMLSGIGTASGNVYAASGAVIQIGTTNTAPETLTINNLSLNNASIRFDLYAGNLNDQLNITGALTQGGANIIDINSFVPGTYNLGNLSTLSGAQVYIGGIAQPVGARQTAVLSTDGANLMLVAGADMSRALRWTGTTSGIWTPADSNWTDGNSVTLFAGGDRVTFDGTSDTANPAHRSIEIAGTGINISDMIVQGDATYTFAGAGINADAASVISGTLTGATGKLVKTGSGTLAFTNAANTFNGGIELGGGAITFINGNQLGDGGNGIRFTGDATLAPAADALALGNNIAINSGKTATFDTAAYNLTLSGTLSTAATGTFVKTGVGKLILAGNSAAAAGLVTNVTSGALLLDGGAFGGTVNVAADATFGGVGSVPGLGSVRTAAGATIQIGLALPDGVLNIANLHLAASSTLTGKGTLTGAAALAGVATAFVNTGESLTLSGSNTGPGGILKKGGGSLVYSAISALGYAGGTQIDEGYVMFRGITGADAASLAHTITLNGGWLDLSDTPVDPALSGSTANNWAGLNIVQGANASDGGVIGVNDFITVREGIAAYAIGNDGKQGVFVVVNADNGVAELTGTNSYKGYTRIDSGTLRVSDSAQLGDTALNREVILNGGALQLGGTFATSREIQLRANGAVTTDAGALTSWNSISGTFAFTKAGSGTLVIANASTAASTNVLEGRYVTGNTGGAGAGVVTVENGAAIEYLGLKGGIVPNRFTGAGALAITSGTTTLGNTAIDIAHVVITKSEVTLANSAQNIAHPSTAIALDASRLNLGAPSTTLGSVAMSNDSTLAFTFSSTAGTAFKRATVSSLTGGGNLLFNTNLGAGRGDELMIADAPAGDYTVLINNTGAAPIGFTAPVALITAPSGGNATFVVPGGKIDAGMYSYEIKTGSANGVFTVSLAGTGALSNAGAIINGMSGALPLSWFSELDTVHQRMGELRLDTTVGKGGLTTWMRGYGQALNFNTKVTGVAFTERQSGVDAGADYKARGTDLGVYFGAFAGYGQTERTFDTAGDGSAESIYGGAYGTLSTPGGWYLDGVLKANAFKNRFFTRAVTGDAMAGDYNTHAFGGSLEAGKNIRFGKGWYIEPQVQAAYTILAGNDYTTTTDLDIEVEWGTTAQLRAGLMLGRMFTSGYGENFQVYVKAHAVSQWTTDGGIIAEYANGERQRFTPSIEGDSFECGAGFAWMPGRATQIFFDYEYANASCYKKPWGVNFGLRYTW